MPMTIVCPVCGQPARVSRKAAGHHVRCPQCGGGFLAQAAPPPDAAPTTPLPSPEVPPTEWPARPPSYHDDPPSFGGGSRKWGGGSAFLGVAAAGMVLAVASLVVVVVWASGLSSPSPGSQQAHQHTSRQRPDRQTQPERPDRVEAQPRPQPLDRGPPGEPAHVAILPEPANIPAPPVRPQPIFAKPWRMEPGRFKTVEAVDRTYTLQVPHDWTVRSADLLVNGLSVWSPRGERLFINSKSVPSNQQTFLLQVQGKQLIRQRLGQQGLSPEEVELLARQVSPFLSPADVVKVYWPGLAAPLVQNMQVTSIQDLPPGLLKLAQQFTGGTGAVLRYQYTFKGQQAGPLLREQFPPALFSPNEVNVEGLASIGTSPDRLAGAQMPVGHNWTLTASGVEGPAEIFRRHQALYAVIFLSVRVRADAAAELVNEQVEAIKGIGQFFLKAGEDMQRQRDAMADFFLDVMGDQVPYYSERENRIYTIAAAEKEEAERQGRSVEGPGGEVLRPATVDDIQRTKLSLVPDD